MTFTKNNTKPLTDKQQCFVDNYCTNGYNASQAYKIAYPNTKAGHNKLSSRLMANDGIKQAIGTIQAQNKAIVEHNFEIAADMLKQRISYLQPAAAQGNVQAIQAQTTLLRELNDIAGLHKQTIDTKTTIVQHATPAQEQAQLQTRLARLKRLEDIPDCIQRN